MTLTLGGDGQISNLTGQVCFFAMQTAPLGFLACSGQAVSRTTYSALFAAIGTVYGAGDGSTTFNLPDLRGEFVRGWDNGRGVDSGRVFGSAQADAFQGHGHNLATQPNGPGGGTGTYAAGVTNNTTSIGAPVVNGAFGTPRTATETRPTNVALLACIKF
jgi:microcystin-dependent protein